MLIGVDMNRYDLWKNIVHLYGFPFETIYLLVLRLFYYKLLFLIRVLTMLLSTGNNTGVIFI